MDKYPPTALWDLKAQKLINFCIQCFRKKRNRTLDRHRLFSRLQKPGETLFQFWYALNGVGASQLQDQKLKVSPEIMHPQNGATPLFLRSTRSITVNPGMYVLEVLTQFSPRNTQLRITFGFRAINTQSDLGQTP